MWIRLIGGVCAVVLVGLLTPAEADSHREEFTAIALSGGGPRSSAIATQLEIVIERWSTEAERQRLLEALSRGQDAALETLKDRPRAGYIRNPPALAWDLHYAHAVPGEDGGQRIFLATDRPIGIWETVSQPRTIDYPFTFIELHVDAHGSGEGKLSRATRVVASDNGRFVQLEHYAAQPVDLTEVHRTE
jgi:hypothetical protein